MYRENRHQPKPPLQPYISSAIAPLTKIYGPYNIFTVSNSRYFREEVTITSTSAPSSQQDSQGQHDYNSILFQDSQDSEDLKYHSSPSKRHKQWYPHNHSYERGSTNSDSSLSYYNSFYNGSP